MQVITTHQNADFDALASLVAAGKLYPGARLVLPDSLNQNVYEFVSLYKDELELATARDIDMESVKLLVITDTRQKSRINRFALYLDRIPAVHVFDHHQATEDDIDAVEACVREVGATTTLLVERIKERGLFVSPLEATLFALGIYEDTGCLTYPSTTLADVAALHFLWEKGVNLRVVNQFLNRPLSQEQRSILDEMLSSTEYHELRGVRVAITSADSAAYVNGLALLTHKLIEIEDVDVVFSIVFMEDRVYVVGRSRLDHFDLQKALAPLGGKGHPKAASAVVKGATVADVREKLVGYLYREVIPVPVARDIMSYPVRTVRPTTTVDRARELMLRYGHSGFPVVEDGKLVGIISRRDLEKAAHHGLGHAPVKGFMSKSPLTVTVDVPVKEIRRIMIENNVGRLPVMENGEIVGLVTRTDVLRNLEGVPRITCSEDGLGIRGDDLTELFNKRLPKNMQHLLYMVGKVADREGMRVYAVGGFIRDLLLGRPSQDLDLVVEPDAISLARKLTEVLRGSLRCHEQFGTANLLLPDGSRLDLVTARQEFYARPAALPEVEQASLKSDLFRRDFTINTLAASLNAPTFGKLYDFYQGLQDLERGVIRVLYNLSFVEDPLRLLRAVRFEQRFQFVLEETTMGLLENAVQTRVLEKVSRERIYEELELALAEEKAPEIIARYFELGLGPSVFPGAPFNEQAGKRLLAAREMMRWAGRNWKDAAVRPSVMYLSALLLDMPFQEARHLCRRLRLPRDEREGVLAVVENTGRLLQAFLAKPHTTPGEIYEALHNQPVETLLMLQVQSSDSRVWEYTTLYWENLRLQKSSISGHDLVEMGYVPGPRFQEVLRAVQAARLNGEVATREEELELIKRLFAEADREERRQSVADQ